MTSVNNYFDKVFVINLATRPDRRISVIQKLANKGIDFEIVKAVNGYSDQNVSEYEEYKTIPLGSSDSHPLEKRYNRKLIQSPGAWGYLKTYQKLLTESKEKGYQRILCFDDDIILQQDFHNQFDKFISEITSNWKLIYLGATQHSWNMPKSHRYRDPDKSEFDKSEPFYHPLITDGSFAIGIDSSVYDLLLREVEKFNAPFDSGPLRKICELYQEKCFVAQANLVIADVSESNIGSNRNQYELAEKVKWNMELYDYPFKDDLISLIIPAYNAEETIEKSIQSVLNQTYNNIEVIVADDGSKDKTVEIVRKLQGKDNRIKVIENNENRGCYFVRNDALRLSKGKIIAIQDADDISLPDRLELQTIPIFKGEAKFTVAHIYRSRCKADELNIDSPEEMLELVESRQVKNKYDQFDYRDREILGFNSSVFHRSVFEEIGLFWEHRFAADAEFAERILYHFGDINLKKDENIHSFLMACSSIDRLYERIDEVLVISTDMGETNITNKHKQEEKKAFEINWRKRFNSPEIYEYPKFRSQEKILDNQSVSEADKLKVKVDIYKQQIESKISAKEQMLEASRKQIKNLENDLSWYNRTYDHLPKWYLKIGGIFRRWPFNKKN